MYLDNNNNYTNDTTTGNRTFFLAMNSVGMHSNNNTNANDKHHY